MPYKQVFVRTYPSSAAAGRELDDVLQLLPDGRLNIRMEAVPETVDLGAPVNIQSTLILSGDMEYESAVSLDGRYRLDLEALPHLNITEFWLIHTDNETGAYRRLKLYTEWKHPNGRDIQPRIAISPGGSFFVADDSGTVRLYSVSTMDELGAFQVAHADTANRIIALAVSPDERLIAGLSSWKDIVLYSVPDRRVVFVRQIKDSVGWYDPSWAYILVTGNAGAIVTIGMSRASSTDETNLSVNAFRFVPLAMGAARH